MINALERTSELIQVKGLKKKKKKEKRKRKKDSKKMEMLIKKVIESMILCRIEWRKRIHLADSDSTLTNKRKGNPK